jgi:hypothetical protein
MDGSLSTPAADKLSSTPGAQREAPAEPRPDVGKVSYRAALLIIVGASLMLWGLIGLASVYLFTR